MWKRRHHGKFENACFVNTARLAANIDQLNTYMESRLGYGL